MRDSRRSRSPQLRSRSPIPSRSQSNNLPSSKAREVSPYSSHTVKNKQLNLRSNEGHRRPSVASIKGEPPSAESRRHLARDEKLLDDRQATMRGNYPVHHNLMQNRPQRPLVDTRQQYGGSPPYGTPTSSYHGSPPSTSPYHPGRGAWSGSQGYHGHQG